MTFAQHKFKTLALQEPPPQIVEGTDPFDDQLQASAFTQAPPDASLLISEIRALMESLNIPEKEIFCKFGLTLENLSSTQLLEVRALVEKVGMMPEWAFSRTLQKRPSLLSSPRSASLQGVRARILQGTFANQIGWICSCSEEGEYTVRLAVKQCLQTDRILETEIFSGFRAENLELRPKGK